MSQNSPDSPRPGTAIEYRFPVWQWLVIAALAVAVLAELSAHAPVRVRWLGLFALLFGLAAGWILGATARLLKQPAPRLVLVSSLVLIALGEVGLTMESYRIYIREQKKQFELDVPQVISPKLFKQEKPENTEGIDIPQRLKAAGKVGQALRDERRKVLAERTRFSSYLKHRVSPLGNWPDPWPALFWCGEILLGSFAGAWTASRVLRN